MTPNFNLGEIWLANLNQNKGVEPGKTRPVVILQSQILLDIGHPSTIILPLTTKLTEDIKRLRIRINARDKLEKDSDVIIDQIRAIDNTRLIGVKPLTKLDDALMDIIYDAVSAVMGIKRGLKRKE